MSQLPPARELPYSLEDYYAAVSGEGPMAYDWKDKPHRLIYDLVQALRFEREKHIKELKALRDK